MKAKKIAGFTLLEMSLVLVVLAVVLGGLMQPILNNREQLLQRQAKTQLEEVRQALLGYAVSLARLPCPATETSAGVARVSGIGCETYGGYVPSVDLGVAGALDSEGVLLDPWSKRLRYRLSSHDSDADGRADFAVTGGMREAGLSQLRGDLEISHWSGESCDDLQLRASHIVAVVYSDGKNTNASRAELLNQEVGSHFATGAFSQSTDCGFDDQLRWISDSALFTHMLRAQRLP